MERSAMFAQIDDGLVVAPHPEPATGPQALRIGSREMVWFWTPPLGPTAIIMLIELDDVASSMPGRLIRWHDLAMSLGLGPIRREEGPGVNHPMIRSLHRLLDFCPAVELVQNVLMVPTHLPMPPMQRRSRWSNLTRARKRVFDMQTINEGELV